MSSWRFSHSWLNTRVVALRLIGLTLFGVGLMMLVMGIGAAESFGSEVSKFFTGLPDDRVVWLSLGGILVLIVGTATTALSVRAVGH